MSLTSLLNLVSSLSDAAPVPAQSTQTAQTLNAPLPIPSASTQPVGNTRDATGSQDEFVFSNPNSQAEASAQAAGLFTVKQPAVFTPAADLLLTTGPPPASVDAASHGTRQTEGITASGALPPTHPLVTQASTQTGDTAVTAVGLAAVTATTAAIQAIGSATPPLGSGNPVTAVPAPSPPGGAGLAALGSPTVQNQLQQLNIALEALGLSATDISKVDQIAALVNEFSPTAYTNLVYQLISQANANGRPAQAAPANLSAANAPANPAAQQAPAAAAKAATA